MKSLFTILPIISLLSCFARADEIAPPYTEAIAVADGKMFAVAIGPGGPEVEFGLSDTNGGMYRLGNGKGFEKIMLSDGKGLKNPTGLTEHNGQLVIVDGNEIISTSQQGAVNWRVTWDKEGVFFYDIETLNENTILAGDFGNGNLLAVDARTGETTPYTQDVTVPGLARFMVTDKGIYAVSWGSDDAWDGSLYRLTKSEDQWQAEVVATGFGNAESVIEINNEIVVGGYRGHESAPDVKLVQIGKDGSVSPIQLGSQSSGISDIIIDGESVYLTFFKDAAYARYPIKELTAEIQ